MRRERLGARTARDGRDGRNGLDGKDGQSIQGRQGDTGGRGPQGIQGPPGDDGEKGAIGPMPRHEWDATRLRFEQGPDGERWGDWVDLQGPAGKQTIVAVGSGGGSRRTVSVNSYFPAGW